MRASKAPEQWQLVLDAANRADYKSANELAVKFEFDRDSHPEQRSGGLIYTYFAKDTTGKVYSNTSASELSKELGKTSSYVSSMIVKRKGRPVTSGDLKGWKFWKEE